MLLKNLALFLLIVEKGGLSAAGRELGLSPASVSERLAQLENFYGASLLNRTTRAIHLTDEGRLLVDGARRLLAEGSALSEAAYAMGFADQAHLQRAFKAHHSMTPGCYARGA